MSQKFNKVSFLSLLIFMGLLGCSPDFEKEVDPKAGNNLSLGTSANDLLSDLVYDSMIIEVAFAEGYEPSASALEELKSFLNIYTHKPGGISIVKTAIELPDNGPYSIAEVRELEKKHRTYFNEGDRLAVFILFANGKSDAEEANKVILGTAYRNTSIVVFEQTLRNMAKDSFISRSEITATTLKHEFGHLFGLVDNGSPAQSEHMDPESKSHCNVGGCLMVGTVEFGKGAVEYIKTRQKSSHQLDSKCHQDLIANGGRM